MNMTRLREIRKVIESLTDKEFDMGRLGEPRNMKEHAPGACGCLAGWTLARYSPDVTDLDVGFDSARKALGLTGDQAHFLFLGNLPTGLLHDLTRKDALHALDTLMETGNPVWPEWLEGYLKLTNEAKAS
jgi:hypothetical protein